MKQNSGTQCPYFKSRHTETHHLKSTSVDKCNGMKVITSRIKSISDSCQREPFASAESIDFSKSVRRRCSAFKVSPNFCSENIQAIMKHPSTDNKTEARRKTSCQTDGKFVRKCTTFTPGDETKNTKFKPEAADMALEKSKSLQEVSAANNEPEVIKTVEEIEFPKNDDQQSNLFSNLLNGASFYSNNYGMGGPGNNFSPYQAYRNNIQNLYNYYQGYRNNFYGNRMMQPWNRQGVPINNSYTQQNLMKYPIQEIATPNPLPPTINGKQIVRKRITTETFYE